MATNTRRIKACADDIAHYEAALKWLEQVGPHLTGKDNDAVFSVELRVGGSCDGAKEAARTLEAYAKLSLPQLVEQAIRSCRNTIAMQRDAILSELAEAPTPALNREEADRHG